MIFFLSFVYGDPVRAMRCLVWEHLKSIGIHRNEAWVLVGDFSELMSISEKLGAPLIPNLPFGIFATLKDPELSLYF